MKYEESSIELLMEYSIKIYDGQITRSEVINLFEEVYKINRNSVSDFIQSFELILCGKKFTRTINLRDTRLIYEFILEMYGVEKLKLALRSVELHLNYYEEKWNVNLISQHKLHDEFSEFLKVDTYEVFCGEVFDNSNELFEGSKIKVEVNKYERNSKARKLCIDYYGYKCSVCDFDFKKCYGEAGKDYIHVHHITPISKMNDKYIVNPVKDLRPICPNCHSIIHRSDNMTIDKLKSIIEKNKKNS